MNVENKVKSRKRAMWIQRSLIVVALIYFADFLYLPRESFADSRSSQAAVKNVVRGMPHWAKSCKKANFLPLNKRYMLTQLEGCNHLEANPAERYVPNYLPPFNWLLSENLPSVDIRVQSFTPFSFEMTCSGGKKSTREACQREVERIKPLPAYS